MISNMESQLKQQKATHRPQGGAGRGAQRAPRRGLPAAGHAVLADRRHPGRLQRDDGPLRRCPASSPTSCSATTAAPGERDPEVMALAARQAGKAPITARRLTCSSPNGKPCAIPRWRCRAATAATRTCSPTRCSPGGQILRDPRRRAAQPGPRPDAADAGQPAVPVDRWTRCARLFGQAMAVPPARVADNPETAVDRQASPVNGTRSRHRGGERPRPLALSQALALQGMSLPRCREKAPAAAWAQPPGGGSAASRRLRDETHHRASTVFKLKDATAPCRI